MFHVTWTQYFLTATVVIGLYYAVAVLLLYSREIVAFTKSGFRKTPSPSPRTHHVASVMGEARTNDMALIEERVGEVRGPLLVADDDDTPEAVQPAGAMKLNLLHDLTDGVITEANAVVKLTIELGSDEAETASLFNALLIRYPEIAASSFRASVNQAIADAINTRLPFRVTVDQVDQWWNE
jgi:hypothetical protein